MFKFVQSQGPGWVGVDFVTCTSLGAEWRVTCLVRNNTDLGLIDVQNAIERGNKLSYHEAIRIAHGGALT